METQSKSIIHSLGHLLCGVICAGAVILTPSTTQAQNLFVSLAGTGSIIEFTNGVAAQQGTFASGLTGPAGLAVDSAGDLFVSENGTGTIIEFTNSVAAQQGTFATGLYPNGLAFDRAGDLFEANENGGGIGTIIEFTNGVAAQQGTYATGVGNPYQVALDSAGDVFLTSQASPYVIEITPGGVRSTVSASAVYPDGLACDSAGDLFVSENISDSIYEFVNNGGTLNSTPINFASGLNSPAGLAFDSAGDLFEADSGSGNIYEFTNGVAAQKGTFATGLNVPGALAFALKPKLNVNIKMFAGIILNNGQVGSNYLIQATSNLSGGNWTTLTNVTLPSNPYVYIDYSSDTNSQQFYRVQPQ